MKSCSKTRDRTKTVLEPAVITGLSGALVLCLAAAAHSAAAHSAAAVSASGTADPQLRAAWRSSIVWTPALGESCFAAAYPSDAWTKVDCSVAPALPFIPRHGRRGYTAGMGAGNGHDWVAQVTGLISAATGSFPSVTGVTSETDGGQPNTYTLQVNTQRFMTAKCQHAALPSTCTGWQQFIFDNPGAISASAFMQSWLLNYGPVCPKLWIPSDGSGWQNSLAVSVPPQIISQMGGFSLTGIAIVNDLDTVIMTTDRNAYAATEKDNVVSTAAAWNTVEFNIFGYGGSSEAVFNKGSKVSVNIALTDGLTSAPTYSDIGTTGETNNLSLGANPKPNPGTPPSLLFTEHH